MFGCLRRVGCLAVLAIAALLYVTRDSWRPAAASALRASNRLSGHEDVAAATDTLATWQPLDQPAAERGERAVRTLAAPKGPVYVNLRPGELASYAFLTLSDLPPALRAAQTAVLGDRIYLRSVVSPADFAGILGGPVRTLIHERDTLRLGGTFDVLRPGLGEFRVRDVQLGAVPVPSALVPRIVARLRASSPPGTGDAVRRDAIPVPLPPFVGDVRVGRGRITLYKTTP